MVCILTHICVTYQANCKEISQNSVCECTESHRIVPERVEIMMTSSNGNIFRVTGHLSPVNSPHKGQWRGAWMFSLICVWINGWVNNREAGDQRRYRAHYDVIVMLLCGEIGITYKFHTLLIGNYNPVKMDWFIFEVLYIHIWWDIKIIKQSKLFSPSNLLVNEK